MSLPTNFKDDLLDTSKNTERVYDIVNALGSVLQADVHLVEKTVYRQQGTELSAQDINAICETINSLLVALNGYKIRALTRAEYNAIPTKDANTFYFILASD